MNDPKAFENVASEEPTTTTSAKELRDFVNKSQLITVSPDVTSDASVVEPDWYIIGGSNYVLVCQN